jgi:hemolysin activation/secretion protein
MRWLAALCLALLGASAAAQPAQPGSPAAPAAAQPRFDVLEFRVVGNTVLGAAQIERAVYAFLGQQRSVADVEAARAALEAAYRTAGYGTVVVDTPEQQIVGGIVTLQVLQGAVARLRVVGSRYYLQGRILAAVPGLAEGEVPNFKAVTEQLAGVNRSADRRVTPLLRPGKTPGTTEVDLTVEDRFPLHGSVDLNNRYSANTTQSRLAAALRYDNLWQREHSFGVQAQTSPQDTSQVKVLSGSYSLPMGTGLLLLSAIRSNSNTVAGVGGTEVFGRGNIYGLRRLYVLDAGETLNQTLTLGAAYKKFNESVSVGGNLGFSTPIRYLPLSANYSRAMTDKGGTWQFGTGLVLALRGLASREEEFANKRSGAQSNFSVLTFDVARSESLPFGMTVYGKLEGQLSDQALISNEQFVAGGVDSVRGYLEAAAVGDKALRGTLELRSPRLTRESWGWFGGLRVHAFAEGAGLWINSPLKSVDPSLNQKARFGLLGAGLGLRLQARELVSLALDVGWPMRDVGLTHKGEPRLHGSASVEF